MGHLHLRVSSSVLQSCVVNIGNCSYNLNGISLICLPPPLLLTANLLLVSSSQSSSQSTHAHKVVGLQYCSFLLVQEKCEVKALLMNTSNMCSLAAKVSLFRARGFNAQTTPTLTLRHLQSSSPQRPLAPDPSAPPPIVLQIPFEDRVQDHHRTRWAQTPTA